MAYTERTNGEVIHALKRWVETHPWSDEPCLAKGDKMWTPREFGEAIRARDPEAFWLVALIQEGARKYNEDPLDVIEQMILANVEINEENQV